MSTDCTVIATKAVYKALAQAELVYGCKFPIGEILFNLKGRAAGQVRYPVNGFVRSLPEMRFNFELLKENLDDFVREVIPHECSHLVVYRLYTLKKLNTRGRPKPHGLEWKSVMRDVYDLQPRVTHSFNVKKAESQKFTYLCGCSGKTHHLSVIRHNKVRRQVSNYLCRSCGQVLEHQTVNIMQ